MDSVPDQVRTFLPKPRSDCRVQYTPHLIKPFLKQKDPRESAFYKLGRDKEECPRRAPSCLVPHRLIVLKELLAGYTMLNRTLTT